MMVTLNASTYLNILLAGSCAMLLVLFTLPLLFSGQASIGLWLMQCMPLLLVLPGMLKQQRRALQWLGFLVLFYLLHGILQSFSADPWVRWLGMLTSFFCVVLFVAAIVRLRHKPGHS